MNREEFDSGEWQEFYSPLEWSQNPEVTRLINMRTVFDGEDFEFARDEIGDSNEDWTEYDERVWNEACEMMLNENERMVQNEAT